MPEGHTIHRLARDHAAWFVGHALAVASPQGRFAEEAAALDGRVLVGVEAYGKHLLHVWDHPERPYVHVHLGLFGSFRHYKPPGPAPTGTTRLHLVGPTRALHLLGPTACEHLDAAGWAAVRARLGEDPLRPDADPDRAYQRLRRRRRPLAAVLLDQGVIAGLGNVYRAEILFVLGLDPMLPAADLPRPAFDALWALAAALLAEGVRLNRIVVAPTAAPRHPDAPTRRSDRLYVYKRRACRVCGGEIARAELEARRLYWCPRCQRGHDLAPPVDLAAVRGGIGGR